MRPRRNDDGPCPVPWGDVRRDHSSGPGRHRSPAARTTTGSGALAGNLRAGLPLLVLLEVPA